MFQQKHDHIFNNNLRKLYQSVVKELEKKHYIEAEELKNSIYYKNAGFDQIIDDMDKMGAEPMPKTKEGDENSIIYGKTSQIFVNHCVQFLVESIKSEEHERPINDIVANFVNTECFVDYDAKNRWATTQKKKDQFQEMLVKVKNVLLNEFPKAIIQLEDYLKKKFNI